MIVRPGAEVQRLLPHGLSLGPQDVTPAGTHPIVVHCNEMFRAHMTIPTLLPNMTYHELILGIPFAWASPGLSTWREVGPFFFMTRVLLDDWLATLGGLMWWGFAKRPARVTVSDGRYEVAGTTGDRELALDFAPAGDFRPVSAFPHFDPVRRIMSQPVVSQLPLGVGPWMVLSNFDKDWDTAELRPLSTSLQIEREIAPGLPLGRFPLHGRAAGIDRSPHGSFELRASWRLSLPRPVWLAPRWHDGSDHEPAPARDHEPATVTG